VICEYASLPQWGAHLTAAERDIHKAATLALLRDHDTAFRYP
jgi:hypothetical protein